MLIIEKPWGKEEILETNKDYTVKKLTMKNGHRCSLQYHEFKKETIYVLFGILTIQLGNTISHENYNEYRIIRLNQGETITIDPMKIHRMEAESGDAVYLECSTSQLNDVKRIEDDFNRA